VMVTHHNLAHNCRLMSVGFGFNREILNPFSWLPLYHDMGLIGHLLMPLYFGVTANLMSSLDFLQQPFLWLKLISELKATFSTVPNFAYDLCVDRVSEEQKASLDLSSWLFAGNGSEPLRYQTIARFQDAFSSCGFSPRRVFPCFGLAEGTLYVTGGPRRSPPVTLRVSTEALEQHNVVMQANDEKGGRILVSSGRSRLDNRAIIVDPQTATALGPQKIGEVWVYGPSVARGYWNRPEQSRETFQAKITNSDTPHLRTGDLGFMYDGNLFVTGRIKDMIIIQGRNHYPQDIELTVCQSHSALRPDAAAAFSVDIDNKECLVVACEVIRSALKNLDHRDIVGSMRQAIAEGHDVRLHTAVLLKPGTLPKTSSGKVMRTAARMDFQNGRLSAV